MAFITNIPCDNEKKITKLYHFSDIHINLTTRHTEYIQVFENLYEFLRKQDRTTGAIVITGDILHSKTELQPECIEITRKFFNSLSAIMPTFFIAGNHDMNMNNDDKMDALTPIYNGCNRNSPLYYLNKSGIWRYRNLSFYVSSVRDYEIIPVDMADSTNAGNIKIALFHGSLKGAILYNGTESKGEINKITQKNIGISTFADYDYVLLGDIHRHQFLGKNIAYAGSLIQQNHGETREGHGVIIWDLLGGNHGFVEIDNIYGYVSVDIDDEATTENLPANIYLRLIYRNKSAADIKEYVAKLKKKYNVISIIYNLLDTKNSDSSSGVPSRGEKLKFNITDVGYQNKLMEEYLCNNNVAENVKANIYELNKLANNLLMETSAKNGDIGNIGRYWRLVSLEFSNLFSFGKNNVVQFGELYGITGIIAENHMGKSAIIDIILYALFDKFPRRGTIKDIINNRKDNYSIKLTTDVGGIHYVVEKSGVLKKTAKSDKEAYTHSCKFYSFNPANCIKTQLNEDSILKTRAAIAEFFGNYNDFIQTNISLQNNNCIFIDCDNKDRKKELERILRIDYICELTKRAADKLRDRRAIHKHTIKECPYENIEEYKNNISINTAKATQYREDAEKIKAEIEQAEAALAELYKGLISGVKPAEEIQEPKPLEKQIEEIDNKILRYVNNTYYAMTKDDAIAEYEALCKKQSSFEKKTQEKINEYNDKIKKHMRGVVNVKCNAKDYDSYIVERTALGVELGSSYEGKNNELYDAIDEIREEISKHKIEHVPQKYISFMKELEEEAIETAKLWEHCQSGCISITMADIVKIKNLGIYEYFKGMITEKDNRHLHDKIAKYERYIYLNNAISKIECETKTAKYEAKIKELREQTFDDSKIREFKKIKEVWKLRESIEEIKETYNTNLKKYKKNKINNENIVKNAETNILIEDAKRKLADLKYNYEQIMTSMHQVERHITENKTMLENIKEKVGKLKQMEAEIVIYKNYVDALGSIPYKLINDICPLLERYINDFLMLTADFSIKIVVDDAIDLYLDRPKYNGKQILLNNTSGFERFVSSLAIRIALLNISQLPRTNFIAIDEGWNAFDATNINNIGGIFEYLKRNFDIILSISHLQIIRQYCDCHLSLEKDANGYSCIKYN